MGRIFPIFIVYKGFLRSILFLSILFFIFFIFIYFIFILLNKISYIIAGKNERICVSSLSLATPAQSLRYYYGGEKFRLIFLPGGSLD